MISIYCDGGSRGNPGPAASAFVVTRNDEVIYKQGLYLGIQTNNFAEYNAVLTAIKWVAENFSKEEIVINLDSQLVERQLNGRYKIKNDKLKKLFDEIKLLILNSSLLITFVWNYREKNKLADRLVNQILNNSSTGKVKDTAE